MKQETVLKIQIMSVVCLVIGVVWAIKPPINSHAAYVNIPNYTGETRVVYYEGNTVYYPDWWTYQSNISIDECNLFNCEGNFVGLYSDSTHAITLRPKIMVGMEFQSTVIHELGHHIWYYYLNSSMKKEFCDMHETSNDFITNYAKNSCSEDFADSFAYYITLGRVMPNNIDYFDRIGKLVFNNNPPIKKTEEEQIQEVIKVLEGAMNV